MSTKTIDWKSDATILKKALLKLTKAQLIKLCKSKKVSSNGTKQDMINRLITKNIHKDETNCKKPKKSKSKSKSTRKLKSVPPELKQSETAAAPTNEVDTNSPLQILLGLMSINSSSTKSNNSSILDNYASMLPCLASICLSYFLSILICIANYLRGAVV